LDKGAAHMRLEKLCPRLQEEVCVRIKQTR
jgi:hypothetical protein